MLQSATKAPGIFIENIENKSAQQGAHLDHVLGTRAQVAVSVSGAAAAARRG
jgi:hypothetical protein